MNVRKIVTGAITALAICTMAPAQAFAVDNDDPAVFRACPEVGNIYVNASIIERDYHIGVGQIFRAGPGGTITVTATRTYTVGVTSDVSASIGVNEIVSASVSAGVSNAVSSSTSTSYQYSHPVSAGRYGNMQYGNYGTRVNVSKTTIVNPCNTQVIASGTATIPSTNVWGYKYWES